MKYRPCLPGQVRSILDQTDAEGDATSYPACGRDTRMSQGAHVKPRPVDAHLHVARYGDFRLTDAIRPGPNVPIVPREGYRIGIYRDPSARFQIPVLSASVSREKLFDVFLELLDPLGEEVDVVLETSHRSRNGRHRDLRREGVDLPVLKSYCCEFEDLLLNDGCTGIAVMSSRRPIEVQFDEHKLIVVYSRKLKPFRRILRSYGLRRDDEMKFLSEGEHLHGSEPHQHGEFREMCMRLGAGQLVQVGD